MSKTLKIVFFGSGPVAARSLDFLVKNFDVEAVITKASPKHHRGDAPVEDLAKEKNKPILFANSKSELEEVVLNTTFKSKLGVVIDYGVLASEKTIGAFPLGIINSHFSLLPQWRGADPITYSLLSGQQKTGVSLMVIEPALDTGKLITQKSLVIEKDDTGVSLTEKLIDLSNKLLADHLPRYVSGEIKPRSQPHPSRATYSKKLKKSDGNIDWNKSAEVIEREIRAYSEWPRSRTKIGEVDCIITKAQLIEENGEPGQYTTDDGKLIIHTTNNSLLIERLQPSGKKNMSAEEFLRGYSNKI